ncbi:unnamed protein product [Protopolystoma xenopodis]|uniref:Uncharacterized protein n=1 Tax=Protopolystoma xenopodis TaxID=117903 RepID=A0A448XMJ2_9PLAT|nr:unnamed protein product [Protopolystoma xenopodis]
MCSLLAHPSPLQAWLIWTSSRPSRSGHSAGREASPSDRADQVYYRSVRVAAWAAAACSSLLVSPACPTRDCYV